MSPVDGLVTWAEQLVSSTGALGLTGVMAAEAVLPISSAVFLPVLGTRVAGGELALVVAVLATTAGSVLGSTLVYGLARWGSRRWVTRLTRLVRLTDQRHARLEEAFARRGVLVVVLGRLVPGVRGVVPLAAGASRLPLGTFIVASAVGSAMWNSTWIGAGAWLTAHRDTVSRAVDALLSVAQPAVLAVAVAGSALIFVHRTRFSSVIPRPVRP